MWSYSGNPSASNLDGVRFNIGDTISTDPQLSDEEILAVLAQDSQDVLVASIDCAEGLAAKVARQTDMDKQVGDLRIRNSQGQLKSRYDELITRLRARLARRSGTMYCGGISQAEKESDAHDTDLIQTPFQIGMHDNNQ